MAFWDKVKQGIDKAGKAAQDVLDEGKLRLDAYRAREQADKAAEALGYAVFRAADAGGELDISAKQRLMDALRSRDTEARKLETDLANARAAASAAGASAAGATAKETMAAAQPPASAATPPNGDAPAPSAPL